MNSRVTWRAALVGQTALRCSIVLCAFAASAFAGNADAADCAGLKFLSLADVTITAATDVKAPFNFPGSTAAANAAQTVKQNFCRVEAVAKPEGSAGIQFEVWLPQPQTWNGNYRAEGTGGSGGAISYAAMVDGLRRGYVTMSSNQGHVGNDWVFAKNPGSVVDFFGRAQHLTTVAAKAVVARYYGKPQTRAYYIGCSRGGDRGIQAAEIYPDDYDGIVANSPGVNWTGQMISEVWLNYWTGFINPAMDIPREKLPLITKAVLAHCGSKNHNLAEDAFLTNPDSCDFNPATLQCVRGQDPSTCLTGPQVLAVEKLYEGARDSVTGKLIVPGYARGSESGWNPGPKLLATPTKYWQEAVHNDPQFDFRNFNFHSDTQAARDKIVVPGKKLGDMADIARPSMDKFKARGGKILMSVGWNDQLVAPHNVVNYLNDVTANLQQEKKFSADAASTEVGNFARLFMVPGMGHCQGGPGPTVFGGLQQSKPTAENDIFVAMTQWVEKGVAPNQIVATRFKENDSSKGVEFTRPLCVYPQVGAWTGKGSQLDAKNFSCVKADK